jgi:MFS family permease
LISGLIIGPQIVVALLAPWVGYHSETYGRKPLLLIGMGLEAVRAGLFAFVTNYPLMVAIQLLDGISGSIINVLTVLVISDLTTGTGRFNLAQGVIGAMIGIAASLSTSITGFIFQEFGHWAGFIFIAGVAATGTALAWLSSRKPSRRNIPISGAFPSSNHIVAIRHFLDDTGRRHRSLWNLRRVPPHSVQARVPPTRPNRDAAGGLGDKTHSESRPSRH